MHDLLQVIITVLGILSQILLLGKQFYSKDTPKGSVEIESGSSAASRTNIKESARKRSLLDLSFVLLCSAFFSLLLTDSLLISGRNPSPGPITILIVCVITLVVVITMCGAWLLGVAELVTGCLGITTLIVLIISSGGPFFSSSSDTVVGLSLLVPILTLIILTTTMLIYSLGSPLNRAIDKSRRIVVSLTLISLILISATALGKQLVKDVINDPRTPKIDKLEAKNLIQNVMSERLQERRKFYTLASEISLARTYQQYFRIVNQEQQYTLQASSTGTDNAIVEQPAPQGTSNSNNLNRQSSNEQKSQSLNNVTSVPSDGISKKQLLKQWIDDAYNRGDYESMRNLQQVYSRSRSSQEILKEQGIGRTDNLWKYFEKADINVKVKYLSNRLNWIHPVGLDGQSQASISLPGISAEERFSGTSVFRIFLNLYDQPNQRQKILQEFEYPERIREFFRERDEKIDSRIRLLGDLELGPVSNLHKPTLFSKFDSTIADSQLQQQLSLPLKEEAFVAYKEYKQLAYLLIKQKLKSKIAEDKLDNLINSFNNLDEPGQDAFLNYVINNKRISPDKVYRMLIDLRNIDFKPLASSQDPLVIEKLISMSDGKKLSDDELQALSDKINSSESKEAKDTFFELIKNENSDTPIKRLFQSEVFGLVDQIHKVLGEEKREFFNAVADPIWLVVKDFSHPDPAQGISISQTDTFPLDTYLDTFRTLDDQNRAGVLQQLAISLYQPGGPYSLDPVRLLISQAKSWRDSAAIVCAALMTVPLLLICILIGGYFSRKLVARDRMRELVTEEITSYQEEDSILGSPVELYGRDDVLHNLRSLAERGWSTIGVVGRRGVGKSRLLYSLFQSTFAGSLSSTVKVWVASPSKFQEEDFISSIFERLALSTEATIASYLGAKPISIRRIESRAAQTSSLFYTGALIVLGLIVYEMYNRLTRSDIVITWLPILALVFTSIWLFSNYLSKLQPVNLSFWLQRDRTHSPHAVMLYKEVYEVLKQLRDRTFNNVTMGLQARGSIGRLLLMSLLAMIFVLSIAFILLRIDSPTSSTVLYVAMILILLSLSGWLYLYQRNNVGGERSSAYGYSIMSLIADYRSFATTVVYRLNQGALGHRQDRKFSVLICVDELDKIIDFEEIRAFVRRIKVIFEVPGVYYYVSLAEDTLTALYLGSTAGKNEIDSAFDHIVRIPPLTCKVGEIIASEYLKSHGLIELPDKLPRLVATVSFGIPRDIIRRCDELIARGNSNSLKPEQLASVLRVMQASMGYELHQLSRGQTNELCNDAVSSAVNAQAMSNEELVTETEHRLVLSIWLLSLIEASITLLHDGQWLEVTEELCGIGYRLPADPITDLRFEIARVHTKILGTPVNIPDIQNVPV